MSTDPGSAVADRLQALVDEPWVKNVALTISGPVSLQMVGVLVREHPPIAHSLTGELTLSRLLLGVGDAS